MDTLAYVFGAVAVVVGIIASVLLSTSHRDSGLWVSFIAVVLVFAAGFAWYQDKLWTDDEKAEKPASDRSAEAAKAASTRSGEIVAGNGETPSHPQLHLVQESMLKVFAGPLLMASDNFPFFQLIQGGETMLMIDEKDGKLLLSALFFNKDGKVLCEIDKNQFDAAQSAFKVKRPAPNRLIVVNDEARTALDLEFVNDRSIRLSGDFYLRHGAHVVIDQDKMQVGHICLKGSPLSIKSKCVFKID